MTGMTRSAARLGCALLWLLAATATAAPKTKTKSAHPQPTAADTQTEPAGVNAGSAAGQAAPAAIDKAALPDGHAPQLQLRVEPRDSVRTGEVIHLEITAVAQLGDDVTIAEQPFAPYEVYKKLARVEAPQNGKQRFVFKLDLLAVEPGDKTIPAIELRVVTKDNFVGSVKTEPVPYKVRSLIANEPNAQPKRETKPQPVLEDNYLPIYILGGLAAAALVAGLTLLAARYLRQRKAAAAPPPPPRPPWDIAVEQLAELRRQKQPMLDAGQGAQFVDQLSDVVRAYLGARYAFDGLETTTDEMLMQLKAHGVSIGFTHEVAQFLGRCDLVKFAKVEPDADEVDLLFAKAQDLVHFSEPERAASPGGGGGAARSAPPGKPGKPGPGAPGAQAGSQPVTGARVSARPSREPLP
jgi:hypothetical protein